MQIWWKCFGSWEECQLDLSGLPRHLQLQPLSNQERMGPDWCSLQESKYCVPLESSFFTILLNHPTKTKKETEKELSFTFHHTWQKSKSLTPTIESLLWMNEVYNFYPLPYAGENSSKHVDSLHLNLWWYHEQTSRANTIQRSNFLFDASVFYFIIVILVCFVGFTSGIQVSSTLSYSDSTKPDKLRRPDLCPARLFF